MIYFMVFIIVENKKLREKNEYWDDKTGGKTFVSTFLKDVNASAERHKIETYGLGCGIRMETVINHGLTGNAGRNFI